MGLGREVLFDAYRKPEAEMVHRALSALGFDEIDRQAVFEKAVYFVEGVRGAKNRKNFFSEILLKYGLSTAEGVALMSLAEALMRVPDAHIRQELIQDKIAAIDWTRLLESKDSLLMKTFAQGLNFARYFMGHSDEKAHGIEALIQKMGKPIVTKIAFESMKFLSDHFVLAETAEKAVSKTEGNDFRHYRFSFDMLGEAARTREDADHYFDAYAHCLKVLEAGALHKNVLENPSLSIKLSALHPRFQEEQKEALQKELFPCLEMLLKQAKKQNTGVTIDAEEASRLDITLDMFEGLLMTKHCEGWQGLTLVVQAYQKRALDLIEWVYLLAKKHHTPIGVRLVKGAYWDSEIKLAQQLGVSDYPVYTRKHHTDISYLAAARSLLEKQDMIYPQFATHNAYTIAGIMHLAGKGKKLEFQRLYGMGEELYHFLGKEKDFTYPCRIYAPVGKYHDLLPYLVRRLLENGANSSFVNKLFDEKYTISDVVGDPFELLEQKGVTSHPKIFLPKDLYGPERPNSLTVDISSRDAMEKLHRSIIETVKTWPVTACSIVDGEYLKEGDFFEVMPPHDTKDVIGRVYRLPKSRAKEVLIKASRAFEKWRLTDPNVRVEALQKAATLLESDMDRFIALLVFEAGKTIPDAVAEVREAIDFCRYYALEASHLFKPKKLPGPTGEYNELRAEGRGVFACISPWNFPLAIFMGQVTAALVTGNTVITKPAEHTALIAYEAVQLLHRAGIPKDVLHLCLLGGKDFGDEILSSPLISGVALTGSTETAWRINKILAERRAPLAPFIAETGGLNAMIVDSSSLLEQVVDAIIRSSFQSAGQRCSALRLLYVQEDIADDLIHMLKGAMDLLKVGDPLNLSTDVGPVISKEAQKGLLDHIEAMKKVGALLHKLPFDAKRHEGFFVTPHLFELKEGKDLTEEAFGPILHIVRYQSRDLSRVIEEINTGGFGLTLGIESRVNAKIQTIAQRVKVGNVYVNRDMIGAVVGVQPFGGQGLSGTGPKAGGPHYLTRFVTEKTYTNNIMAAGGNVALLMLD